MFQRKHPIESLPLGNDRYRLREIAVILQPGGREAIVGVFRDDSGRGTTPRGKDIPATITLPAGFNAWEEINFHVCRALEGNPSVVHIDMREA
jgi:hypothetical protein